MSFANLKATGIGRLDFRLEIAGWPHEWTTSALITHSDGRDSREVFPGLQYTGLKITEKAILKDCWTQQGQLTVKIKPTTLREETVDSFTRNPAPVAYLAEHDATPGLEYDSTVWSLDGAASLPAGFYHIASECLYYNGGGTLTRARWSTTAQRHYIAYGSTSAISVPIYAYPPTMEGRRAVLYAYGEGDSKSGDGLSIWRGIVARPPALDSDGLTWTIQLDPIIKALEQNVAASEALEYHIRGIYHSANAPIRITYRRFGSPYGVTNLGGETAVVTGFFENDDALATAINTKLDALISQRDSELTGHTSELASARYYTNKYGAGPTIAGTTSPNIANDVAVANDQSSSSTVNFAFGAWFFVESYLEGYCTSGVGSLASTAADTRVGGAFLFVNHISGSVESYVEYFGDGQKSFATPLTKDSAHAPIFAYPLSNARAMLGSVPSIGVPPLANDPLSPSDRLYLDVVDGIETDDIMLVKNGDVLVPIKITSVDLASKIVTANIMNSTPCVWFDANTKIMPVRVFAQNAALPDFLQGLQDAAINANDGDTPYVPPGDISVSAFQAVYANATVDDYWRHRNYMFQKPTPIKRIVQEELKVLGCMTRIEADGSVGCVPLPLVSSSATSTSITDRDILLPARGMVGDWVRWQAQSDGLVNTVTVRLGYNPATDDYDTTQDYSVRDISSIAEHKTNGTKGNAEIAPVSTENQPVTVSFTINVLFLSKTVSFTGSGLSATTTDVALWVQNYLRILSMDYATVTIAVPFKFFDLLVGDTVDVTCKQIPDGNGRRGITSKKAIIVGREWSLDPATNNMGMLTLYFPREVYGGYAPSAHVTSQSNVSGNTWNLTCDGADDLNVRMSESLDGNVTKHFGVGDKVVVIQRDAGTIPINVNGTVVSVTGATIRVVFDDAWDPGTDDWLLEYQQDDGTLTAHQTGFVYVADTIKQMHDGSVARRYV